MENFFYIIFYLIIVFGPACIWGAITWKVNDSKGYASNGFWWGFFLGWIGLIVVACRPNVAGYEMSGWKCVCGKVHSDYVTACACGRTRNTVSSMPVDTAVLAQGGWQCTCGRTHATYVSSCVCGVSKRDALAKTSPSAPADEQTAVSLIKEYKTLLDSGAITPEEFEAKKKQLLGQ